MAVDKTDLFSDPSPIQSDTSTADGGHPNNS